MQQNGDEVGIPEQNEDELFSAVDSQFFNFDNI